MKTTAAQNTHSDDAHSGEPANESFEVLLLTLPFGPLYVPSIGLALLQAELLRQGLTTQTRYFTFRFAELIGRQNYQQIADETETSDLVGEWVFSHTLADVPQPAEPYLDAILRRRSPLSAHNPDGAPALSESFLTELLHARTQAEPFLDECVKAVLACQPKIVGFTSTFQQHVASLALAKRLKAQRPDLFIVFGGANCEGAMGHALSRQYSFVDAVVSGEGEVVFPELVRRVLRGQPINDLPGVFTRRATLPTLGQVFQNAATVEHLDELPYLDYDEFFAAMAHSGLDSSTHAWLLFETARGCWWGEKHHCTFCGLNGQGMRFRSKSPERALAEFKHLTAKYPGLPVSVVDNILSMDYFKNFIPQLAVQNPGVEVFYEIKANLKKEQLRMLAAAGVTRVQPGIESLTDQVLQLMDKGVRALHNIQLLKWCEELGIWPQWNFLYGFPGEQPAEYARVAEWVPLLAHLPPPLATASIRIDRFSPNFDQAEARGFQHLAPAPAYAFVYDLPAAALNQMAYYFSFEYREPRAVLDYVEPAINAIIQWRQSYKQSSLLWLEKGEDLLVLDQRPVACAPVHVLKGLRKFVYQACEQVRTARQVYGLWQAQAPASTLAEVRAVLNALVAQKLMLRQDENYLALATATQPETT
jgi:ribosomal peptide maturation radical SAM protein 1